MKSNLKNGHKSSDHTQNSSAQLGEQNALADKDQFTYKILI